MFEDEKGYDREYRLSLYAQYFPKIKAYIEKQLHFKKISYLLPKVSREDKSQALVKCDGIYLSETLSKGSNLLMVVSFDFDGKGLNANGIVDDGWTVYSSQESIYISASSEPWLWGCGNESFMNFIVGCESDEVKMSDVEMDDVEVKEECLDISQIHKFSIAGGRVQYKASGSVSGRILNQFSMSEYNGYLRVASSQNSIWDSLLESDNASNAVWVLKQEGNALKVVGEVKGISKGEKIYAARFLGDRGYFVTFEKVGPMFTLDMSDPTKPVVKDELEGLGFSSYIHPMDENHLLPIGLDGTESGGIGYLRLQIFDVSDISQAKLVHEHNFRPSSGNEGWITSKGKVLLNHHLFNYHAGSGLLSTPMQALAYTDVFGERKMVYGFVLLKVTAEGIREIGRVNHDDIHNGNLDELQGSMFIFEKEGVYDKGVYLYSISNKGLLIHEANSGMKEVKRIGFEQRNNFEPSYPWI